MTTRILWECYGSVIVVVKNLQDIFIRPQEFCGCVLGLLLYCVKCIVSSPVTKGHVRYCRYLAFVVVGVVIVSKGLHYNLLH